MKLFPLKVTPIAKEGRHYKFYPQNTSLQNKPKYAISMLNEAVFSISQKYMVIIPHNVSPERIYGERTANILLGDKNYGLLLLSV